MTILLILVGTLHGCAVTVTAEEQVTCRIAYQGEAIVASAMATTSAYEDEPTLAGTDFLFRIVYQRQPPEQAAIKLYTYAVKKEGPALVHLARFPYPMVQAAAGRRFGFTGLQSVFEPVGGEELAYWCELDRYAAERAKR